MNTQTVKCPICGKPYVFLPYYVGDQSACPKCRAEARENTKAGMSRNATNEPVA